MDQYAIRACTLEFNILNLFCVVYFKSQTVRHTYVQLLLNHKEMFTVN